MVPPIPGHDAVLDGPAVLVQAIGAFDDVVPVDGEVELGHKVLVAFGAVEVCPDNVADRDAVNDIVLNAHLGRDPRTSLNLFMSLVAAS